jgi:glucose dehydrogenase
MTLDVTTGELFVPVGNPWPDIDVDWRPGTNLFTNSIVVLDARTGALKWWYQALPSDSQDLDLTAAPVLYRDSQIRDVMAFAGKDGFLVAVDRETHKPIFRTPVITIENLGARASKEGVHVCPGFAGGVQWNGPTLDRLNNALITGAVEWCMTLFSGPTAYGPPKVSYGGYPKPDPEGKGAVVAVEASTGKVLWRYDAPKPVIAGVTPTAGGVTFAGDMGGNLLALDSKTGVLIHKVPTGGALAGGLVTYEARGKQYLAMASGNVSRNTFGVLGVPSVVIMALNAKSTAAAPARAETGKRLPGPASAARGSEVYVRICASCHGSDGDMIADHRLSTLNQRRDAASTTAFIKDPKLPMPKVYPGLITAQDVADVSAFVLQGLRH